MTLRFKPAGLKLLAALSLCGLSVASIAQTAYVFPPQGAPGAIMTFKSGPLPSGTPGNAAALIQAVNAAVSNPTAGYGSAIITNSASVQNQALVPNGSAQNIAEVSTFAFGLTQPTTIQFRAGLDTGTASSLVIDGVPATFVTANQWWDGNWNNAGGVSMTQPVTLPAGNHTFQVFGLEPCCSGAQSFQYMIAGGQWTNFSANDSKLAVLPATAAAGTGGESISTANDAIYRTKSTFRLNPTPQGGYQTLQFKVKASNDAHVRLGCDDNNFYEIVMSGWGNTQSVIRRGSQQANQVTVATGNMLSGTEARDFWVSTDMPAGTIRVGRGTDLTQGEFMKWTDTGTTHFPWAGANQPLCFSMMTGWGATGEWSAIRAAGSKAAVFVPQAAPNVALGKPTFQTSTGWGGTSNLAVDGKADSNWGAGGVHMSHTMNAKVEYWEVNLLGAFAISNIKIGGRTDCCAGRILGATLQVFNGSEVVYSKVIDQKDFASNPNMVFPLPAGTVGNYVRVVNKPGEYLTLAEVAVEGAPVAGNAANVPPPAPGAGKGAPNLAFGKPTFQTSTGWGGSSDMAVDGKDDPNWGAGGVHMSHTMNAKVEYWEVNLLGAFAISNIKIGGRTDCCADRILGATVQVFNGSNVVYSHVIDQKDFAANPNLVFPVPAGTVGNYVRVINKPNDYLTLAEVVVQGAPAPGAAATTPPPAPGAGESISTANDAIYRTKPTFRLAPTPQGGYQTLQFKVKASNDAHVRLGCDDNNFYEIVLSGWGNTQSVIRRGSQQANQVTVATGNMLSGTEARDMWVATDMPAGTIRVGMGTDLTKGEFMKWTDAGTTHFPWTGANQALCFSMMTGWGATGEWSDIRAALVKP